MKIRIFALAKELDYDSKELINHCNDAGIPVKSSALASISPDERDRLLEYLDSLKSNKTSESPQATSSTPNAPQFDPEKTIGKVRSIRTMTPRSTPEPRRETPVAEKPVAETQAPVSDEVESVEDVNESTAEPEVEDVKQEPVEAKAEEAPEAEPVPELVEESPVAETDTDTEATVEEATEKESTDQYIPPIGNMGSRIRDMKPRASIPDAAPRKPKPKQKPKPSLPNLAIPPKFKAEAPVKKKDEAPAQKPDVKLTAEILDGQSPLAAHIRKHDERDRNKKAGDADTDRPSRRGRLSGITEQREERRQQRKRTPSPIDDDRDDRGNRRRNRQRRTKNIEYKSQATVEQPITVRSLSEAMGRPAKDLMTVLFKQGKMAKINDALDDDLATELAIELGVDLEIKRPVNLEDALTERLELELHKDNVELIPRAPIVTILGHVDHGKTTLVDTLRSSNVVSGEAGGITQHIAAYQVEKNGQKITFVDTPGHAAFGEMRSRGANVTDMIILVVAANDGVKPQTIECISHAKAAGVPMIVALNKIDLPDINEQKVLQELAAHNVLVSEWGGDIELVRTSGLNNIGIDDLLETILLTAELQEFKAAKNVKPYGVCLEAFRDEGRGPIAWMIVQQGTLHVGDIVVCGNAYGRIRAMFNEYDKELTEAPPSTPVKVAGLNIVPNAGSHFFVMSDVEEARAVAEERIHQGRTENLANRGGPKTLEQILGGTGPKDLPVILKADSPGSIEALRGEIEKFDHPEVRVEVLHTGVGGVNESDVSLAAASGAIIVAFHVIAEERAELLAQNEGVNIRRYRIIYEVTEDIKRALEGLLAPEAFEVTTGRAIVLQTFSISRMGTIAGCRILNGTISRNDRVHVIRDQTIINNYAINSLKREKEDAKSVREGMECGIRLEGFNDIKEGDLLEAYRIDEKQRTLDD
ncbi:MAG: translation initiation factor IF-2 [Rubinisphaera sp.]|nr:translation initiation factor IF-2 [Rubinisphaera sp.]MBV07628.1 translation initiation factor IF-2 [Rubinisphaera sp.]